MSDTESVDNYETVDEITDDYFENNYNELNDLDNPAINNMIDILYSLKTKIYDKFNLYIIAHKIVNVNIMMNEWPTLLQVWYNILLKVPNYNINDFVNVSEINREIIDESIKKDIELFKQNVIDTNIYDINDILKPWLESIFIRYPYSLNRESTSMN
jgi:hypothetical protein